MSTTSCVLRAARTGNVVTLMMDRPDCGNAIDVSMARALLSATLDCADDRSVRCVVLTGAGQAFCTGGDIRSFGQSEDPGAAVEQITAPLHMAIARLARMEKPLLVAVNGVAAGAGFGLALLGDVVLAARSAKFAVAYGAIGVSPDAGTSWLLPRLVGLREAQRLALRGERIDAADAERLGIVSRVVDDFDLAAATARTAQQLAELSGTAVRRTRALLHASYSSDFAAHLEEEAESIAAATREADGREGITAFLAKRKPQFGGR